MGPVDAVVVAAGTSARMGGGDKLRAPLLGRSVLSWAIEAVALPELVERIIVVVRGDGLDWLAQEPSLRDRIEIVAGGERRQESVAAGVRAATAPTVLVHDGARPLATRDLARRVVEAAGSYGAVIPVLAVGDTVKRIAGDRVLGTLPREDLALAQTPQAYRRDTLLEAWRSRRPEGAETWTDEAAMLEASGVAVRTVEGEPENLKVTVAADLPRAEAILARRLGVVPGSGTVRMGLGRDSHPFGPGRGLALGGIRIAESPSLSGHSDGDVGLHALADALLGASALGDLGRMFPATDPATSGIDSGSLLRSVVDRLATAGYEARSVDLTIVCARPHLGESRLAEMREAIAGLTGLAPERVSVKASSGNLSGDEGAGRVISAHAVATVLERGSEPRAEWRP